MTQPQRNKLDEWFQIVEHGTSGDQVMGILYDWKFQNNRNAYAVKQLFIFIEHDPKLRAHTKLVKLMTELAESIGLND